MAKKSTPKPIKVTKVITKVPNGTNYASKVDKNFNPSVPKKLPKQDDNAILIPIDKRRKRR